MHRLVRRVLLAIPLLLLVACAIGSVQVWAQQGRELLVPGAEQVQIVHTGLFRVQASYSLPEGQNVQNVLRFLRTRGWQRQRIMGGEPEVFTLIRPGWAGRSRDILIVSVSIYDRQRIELQYGRCFRNAWVSCL